MGYPAEMGCLMMPAQKDTAESTSVKLTHNRDVGSLPSLHFSTQHNLMMQYRCFHGTDLTCCYANQACSCTISEEMLIRKVDRFTKLDE